MYVGKKLRQLRLSLDINQTEMANSLDLSQSYYSAVEAGKRKISKKMIEKITEKYKLNEGYFSNESTKNNPNNMRGNYEGVLEGVVNKMAEKKGLGGENKSIFAMVKLMEKLISGDVSDMKNEDLMKVLLEETSKWEDKTINYYFKLIEDNKANRPELTEIKKTAADVITNAYLLSKISTAYLDSVLNENISFTDYESFKANRIANFEKLLPYKEALEPLAAALRKFLIDFAPFDTKNIIENM